MPTETATIELRREQFTAAETLLASFEGLSASTFRYDSGVLGLRISNAHGHISLLPFQGQQIWDAAFFGRPLAMRSMFEEPYPTEEYLRSYGAFFIHCGATSMGGPGPEDRHPLHGELPNARYRDAQLLIGRDSGGPFMGLSGSFKYTVAFSHNYLARPIVKLHASSGRIQAGMTIRNLKHAPMELMYLAHINFRPVENALLIDTVPRDARHMRVREALPPQFTPAPEYLKLLRELRADPNIHRRIDPDRVIDPELVLSLDCRADDSGWAHAMQLAPDGSADFVSHRPDQLSHALRWICRNADQNALGLILPATAEADGYSAEKAKGNLRTIPPQGEFRCDMEFGALDPEEAAALKRRVEALMH